MGVQFSRLQGALDLAFDKRAQARFEQIQRLADPFVIGYRRTLLLSLVRAHQLGVLACKERSLFSFGLLIFSRQSSDLRPALHQRVVAERLGGAFFAFTQGVEPVAEFAGDLGFGAELGQERGGRAFAAGFEGADKVVDDLPRR